MSTESSTALRERVREHLPAPTLLIGGEEVAALSGETIEDRDPSTGGLLAQIPNAGAADVERAVAAARAALPGWAGTSGAARGRVLCAIADALEADAERIASLECSDNGRPHGETASQSVIVARWFRYFGGMADKVEGATIPVEGPYLNYTKRVPVGVCGAITPWNHPMLIATKKIAPALAMGNTVVVKPSELAPLSVLELGRLALRAGLPPGVLNIVLGGREAGEALSTSAGVDRIDVTGSTPTGIAVARAAAGTLKRVGFELGGKAANIVFADADLERAVRGAAFSAFIAQGQSCVSGARLLVQRDIAESFAQALAERVAAIRLGDPLDRDTQIGPVITPASATRIRAVIEGAQADGAVTLTGGPEAPEVPDGLSPDGFVRPTVLWTADPSIRAAQEEIFGPVVTVIPFDTEEDAVAIANSVPFGLGAAVWTSDVSRAHRMADRLVAGITWINDYHRIDPASPWGGFRLSGYGRENGWAAVEEYTAVKSVWVPLEPQEMDWYDTDRSESRRLN
jgi:acyl-CoA reductase-like NAD-dependent aldehyde dehydrogenase